MKLSNKQVKHYQDNGYLILRNAIRKNEINIIIKRLTYLTKSQKDGRGLSEPGITKSLVHSLHLDKELKKIIENKPWFQNVVKKLLNCNEVYVWNAKSNLKLRWNGSVEYYHQDYIYWRDFGLNSANMLNCMIFIDNHNHGNAGLWVFPKSHNKILKHEKFLNINSLQKFFIPTSILDKINKKNPVKSITEKSGSCIFFHSKLIHGSSHNISPKNRRILLYDVSNIENFKSIKKKGKLSLMSTFNRNKRIKFELKELKKRINNLKI